MKSGNPFKFDAKTPSSAQPILAGRPKRFVALDRDGTIIVEHSYLADPDLVELLPNSGEGLRRIQAMGLGLVVVTNQSGVGRGYFSAARVDQIHQRLCKLLEVERVWLDGVYVCPHSPDADCSCRKPKTGLLEHATRDLGLMPQTSFVIGDKASDIGMGLSAGSTTILVRTGYGAELAEQSQVQAHYVVDDLLGAAQLIQGLLN